MDLIRRQRTATKLSDLYENVAVRRLLSFAIFLALMAPPLLVCIIDFRRAEAHLTQLTTQRRQSLAALAAATLKERFDGLTGVARALAGRVNFRRLVAEGEWEEAVAIMAEVPEDFPEFDRVSLVDAGGTVMANTSADKTNVGQDFSHRDWYRGVSDGWEPYVSEIFVRQGDPPENVVSIAVPIRAVDDDRVIGILNLQVPVKKLFGWSQEIDVGENGFAYFVDQRGHLAEHPKIATGGEIIDYSGVPSVAAALSGASGVALSHNPYEDETRLSGYAHVEGYGWAAVVTQPEADAFAARDKALLDLLKSDGLFLLLLAIAAATVVYLLSVLQRLSLREKVFLSSLGEGLGVTDQDGKLVYLNPAGASILHLKPEEAIGRHWFEVAAKPVDIKDRPIAEKDRAFHLAMRKGRTETVVYKYVRLDGTSFPAVVTTAPVTLDGAIIGVINVFRDISTEVELERERGELLSIASHQMRTPLTSMRWIAEMLLRGDAGRLTRAQREQLRQLSESNQRLTGLVNDMLNVSKLEAGTIVVAPSPTDLPELAKSAAKEVEPLAKEKKQTLDVRLPKSMPVMTVDGKLVREAMLNLLSNAIKYSPEGGTVTLAVELRETDALVSVQDNGIGIPPGQRGRMFQKFFRAENAVQSGSEGTGLGLYVVKQIVERSGGTIDFVSEPGKGTRFFFTLPLDR